MANKDQFLEKTLTRLEELYDKEKLIPGTLNKVGLKPGWNTIIGTDGQCGMAMSFSGPTEAFGKPRIDHQRLLSFIGGSLFEVAKSYLKSESWQERAIGVACLSALSQPLLHPSQLEKRGFEIPENAGYFSALIKPDDITAVVGYGGGISQLIAKCRELHVTDMRPRDSFQGVLISDRIEYTPREVQVHPEKDNKEVIAKATVVIITGSSLVNGTFQELMSYVRNARLVIAYGASVALIPDVFFEHGVDFIHSHRIIDPQAFESGVLNEMNMEAVIQRTQKSQAIRRRRT
jgi:uncharacterized protein (DUF4213/DUF364 family)